MVRQNCIKLRKRSEILIINPNGILSFYGFSSIITGKQKEEKYYMRMYVVHPCTQMTDIACLTIGDGNLKNLLQMMDNAFKLQIAYRKKICAP